ncbi:pleckstrin homology domain-containing family H member 1 [Ciona intestinalis]
MDGRDSPRTALEWKKLYLQMEGKLKQFRVQATGIRTKLSQKMEELTLKFEQAEARAADAEFQLVLLRESLAGVPGAASEEDRFTTEKMSDLEKRCLDQQERIVALEKELECEKYLRKVEKEMIHEKAFKIKEWVSSAMSTAEKEKNDLRESNERLNAAVQAMQLRLTELLAKPAPAPLSTKPQPVAIIPLRDSDTAFTCETPSVSSPGWQNNPLFKDHEDTFVMDEDTERVTSHTDMDLDNSEEVDDVTVLACDVASSTSSPIPIPSKPVSESVRIPESPRARFITTEARAVVVKSTGDHELHANKDSPKSGKKKSSTLPMTRSNLPKSDSAESSPPNTTHHHFMGTFGSIRRRFKGLTEHQRHRSHEDSPPPRGREKKDKQRSKSKSPATRSNSTSRLRTSPITVPGMSTDTSPAQGALPAILQEEEDMVVDPPGSPHSPTSASILSSSLPLPRWKGAKIPPTIPQHRLPTWEAKIYSIAENGFRLPSNAFNKQKPSLFQHDQKPGVFAEIVYKLQPVTVPVYTKTKGRAALIKPTPFTDASDSSDEDPSSLPRQLSPRHHPPISRSLSSSAESSNPGSTQQKRNGSPAQLRATKRANSQQSMASSEGDYAIPPDAMSTHPSLDATDSSEPEHKLFKTSPHPGPSGPVKPPVDTHTPTAFNGNKAGYLSKLGGRVRAWKKRWFVLQQDALVYYKSPGDVGKKPQGQIPLTALENGEVAKATRDYQTNCTFHIVAEKRTYYFIADSQTVADDWVKAICDVAQGSRSHKPHRDVTSVSGWLKRTIGGNSCRVWARFNNGVVECYADKQTQTSMMRLSLRGCEVEDVQLKVNPGHNRSNSPPPAFEHVIVVRPISDGEQDVFFSFDNEAEKAAWFRAMTSSVRTSSENQKSPATEVERLFVRLLQSEPKQGVKNATQQAHTSIWRNPVLCYNKQGLSRPLTTLSSEALQTEAMKIAKSIQLFTNVSLDVASADYHVTLVQRVAHSCLTHVELRNEIYAQLIKVTNRRDSEVDDASYLQAWKLFSLILPLFLPGRSISWCLGAHLKRHSTTKAEAGQYVIYCQRALERTKLLGERMVAPSKTECLSILLQNPYHHSLPFSVPVHFSDTSYQVVSFDGSTTVSEFTTRVSTQLGIRHQTIAGFALYVDDPDVTMQIEHCIEPSVKICDVISIWETVSRLGAVTSKGVPPTPQDPSFDITRHSARFTYRRRLTFQSYTRMESDKEKKLIAYQLGENISRDTVPITRELSIEATPLAAKFYLGDQSRTAPGSLDHVMRMFHPHRYQEGGSKHQQKLIRERINDRWVALEGSTPLDCTKIFLNVLRKYPLCGAALFLAKVETPGKQKGEIVWLAVTEDAFHVLSYKSMEVKDLCRLPDVVTFGGCRDNLMVVSEMAGVTRKLFFHLPMLQMLELVRLLADYMNAAPLNLRPNITSP